MSYDFKKVEKKILRFWEERKIPMKVKEKNTGGKKFFHLDGPPYVTGSPHPGIGMNRCLKDMVRRYKRFQGFDVWDQPGFDMHGLPIENGVEKLHKLKNKEDIVKFGVKRFIDECRRFSTQYLDEMVDVFKRVGEWADWNNPYMSTDPSFLDSVWWAVKESHNKGALYRGHKVLTWCPRCGTALAGNYEVIYKNIKDNSIFVKLPIDNKTFLIVWTTTPWTIPYNMAVMANPKLDYVKVDVGGERWIMAKGLVAAVMATIGKGYRIVEEFKGKKLLGVRYKAPFADEMEYPEGEKNHTVVLSRDYVDLSAGTGLVHCATGCGPEDYEVGKEYGIKPFNDLDDSGVFTTGKLKGMVARKDDRRFAEMLKKKGLVVHEVGVEHEYPHCERCKTPVVFKLTEQWFLEVTKFKDKMLKANKSVYWVPEWAGKNQFKRWLENIKDWCISRQRFWGIPIPVWECESCGKYEIIGGVAELAERAKVPKDLHKPEIDGVTWKCKCGGTMRRSPDVLDVWIDSACTPFASLGYPSSPEPFKTLFPVDFIIESKDQIRGWFYGLMGMSMMVFDECPYKAVEMHGFTCDSKGEGMSKRKGNYVPMKETLEKHGADVFRLFVTASASPGVDVRYDERGMKATYRTVSILWNAAKFIENNMALERYEHRELGELGVEDRWILSRVNRVVKEVTEYMEQYRINDAVKVMEPFIVEDLSRWYLKLKKGLFYSDGNKGDVLSVLDSVLSKLLPITSVFIPFVSEAIFQQMKKYLGSEEESVFLNSWPDADERFIDSKLEKDMDVAREVVASTLRARDMVGVGLRWPLPKVTVVSNKERLKSCKRMEKTVLSQTNVKSLELMDTHPKEAKMEMRARFGSLKERVGSDAPAIVAMLVELGSRSVKNKLDKDGAVGVQVHGKTVTITANDVEFKIKAPKGVVVSEMTGGTVYLCSELDAALVDEGTARELMRRIQEMRKEMGLTRHHKVKCVVETSKEKKLSSFRDEIEERCGCRLSFGKASGDLVRAFKVRKTDFKVGLKRM